MPLLSIPVHLDLDALLKSFAAQQSLTQHLHYQGQTGAQSNLPTLNPQGRGGLDGALTSRPADS